MSKTIDGFFIVPFAIDGEPEGVAYRELGQLSSKWLAICDQHLEQHGEVFDAPWAGNLSHIKTRLTSASGAALLTFSVHGRVAAPIMLASGLSPQTDLDVSKLFIASLQNLNIVREAATAPEPFRKVLEVRERPAIFVVPWPDETIGEQDQTLVRELALHMTGAFFNRTFRS